MTVEEFAKHYVRYWSPTGELADNAPTELWVYVKQHPSDSRTMIHQALCAVASGSEVQIPELPEIMSWFASRPEHLGICESAFRSKKPASSFEALMKKSYKNAVFEVVTNLYEFLRTQINK